MGGVGLGWKSLRHGGVLDPIRGVDERVIACRRDCQSGPEAAVDGRIDDQFVIMARTDDIINVAGHRLSTGGMEEVLAGHHDVAECAVIGINDALKGQIPLGFVILKSGIERAGEVIIAEIVQRVRDQIGPVAALR